MRDTILTAIPYALALAAVALGVYILITCILAAERKGPKLPCPEYTPEWPYHPDATPGAFKPPKVKRVRVLPPEFVKEPSHG